MKRESFWLGLAIATTPLGFAIGWLVPILIVTACAARPAGRDVCYAQADADALVRYVRECDGYESTAECPAAVTIEADHEKAQEACP